MVDQCVPEKTDAAKVMQTLVRSSLDNGFQKQTENITSISRDEGKQTLEVRGFSEGNTWKSKNTCKALESLRNWR